LFIASITVAANFPCHNMISQYCLVCPNFLVSISYLQFRLKFCKCSVIWSKTVKGPSPLKVSTNPAAVTAVTSVEKSAFPAATPTMFESQQLLVSIATVESAISVDSAFDHKKVITLLIQMH
jgi:hypothetical protein